MFKAFRHFCELNGTKGTWEISASCPEKMEKLTKFR